MIKVILLDHSLTKAKGHSDFKIQTCFPQNLLSHLKTKCYTKAYGIMGMEYFTNKLGHMLKMAAMPIYDKNL